MKIPPILLVAMLLAVTSCATLNEMKEVRTAAQPILFDQTATLASNLEAPTQTQLATRQLRSHMAKVATNLNPTAWAVTKLRKGEVIKIQLPIQQLFAPNDTLLSAEAIAPLTSLQPYLSDRYNIAIVTHADNTGTESYTQQLTKQRAEAITHWLIEAGATATTLASYPMGSTQPLQPNNNVKNRAQNRRIELYLIPTTALLEELRHTAKQ